MKNPFDSHLKNGYTTITFRSDSSVVKILTISLAFPRTHWWTNNCPRIDVTRLALLPYRWKEFLHHEGCSFNMKSIFEHGLIAGGTEKKGGRRIIFFAALNPFGKDEEKKQFMATCQFRESFITAAIGNMIKTPFSG